jgi:uncharacterized protein YjbI with pentapeptide repeats
MSFGGKSDRKSKKSRYIPNAGRRKNISPDQLSKDELRLNSMINEEHLMILKQGVNVWNEWRKNNPQVIPIIGEVNLSNQSLSGINFDGVKLLGTNLNGSNLADEQIASYRQIIPDFCQFNNLLSL